MTPKGFLLQKSGKQKNKNVSAFQRGMIRLFLGEGEDILTLELLIDEQGFIKAQRSPDKEWEQPSCETRVLGYIAKNTPALNVNYYSNDSQQPTAGFYPIIATASGLEVSEYAVHFFKPGYDPKKDF